MLGGNSSKAAPPARWKPRSPPLSDHGGPARQDPPCPAPVDQQRADRVEDQDHPGDERGHAVRQGRERQK
jgi:hypothetical protein